MACLTPFHVENKKWLQNKEPFIPVPCGKCPPCVKRRAAQWIFRLKQQDKVSSNAHFVTLTYGDEHLPLTPNGFMTLVKTDLQKYFKRLRKLHGRSAILKYYAVGEYGTNRKRPHYHIILFNATEKYISEAWNFGGTDIGGVSGASIGYVTGYVQKGKIVPEHKRDDREKEFSLMSKGLGSNYLNEANIEYHLADQDRQYVVETGNTKVSMPRYYKQKIYSEAQVRNYGHRIKYQIDKIEQKKMSDFVSRTGSLKGYSRSLEETKKHLFETFYKKEANKRDIF